MDTLIVGSAIYGLGETVQLSFNVAIGELVPNKYRPMVLSFIFLTNAPFATFGPIISRLLSQPPPGDSPPITDIDVGRKFVSNTALGWRWCYYINIIAVGLAIILLFFFYHPPTFDLLHERKTKRQLMKQLDCKS